MAADPEFRKKLQIFLVLAIVLAAARAGYIVYDRYETRKEDEKPKQETAMNADFYVTPKKLHAYDLKSAKDLTKQPVWVKVGYGNAYYPYDPTRHKTDFVHDAGTLGPLQKLQIVDVVTGISPQAPDSKQVLALFQLDGKSYAVPIGVEKDSDFKIYTDELFFIEDPHDLYKHWSHDIWKAVDAHEVHPGMNELQAALALGLGVPQGGGSYGSRTLKYPNGGKPLTVTFSDGKATAITPGT